MKKLISLALALALCLGLAVPVLAADFSDVPASHSFHDAITWCADRGIVGGYSDGTFKPANTVTKSNFAVMLSRAFYADAVGANQTNSEYTQVSTFYPNFMALYTNGILEGVSFSTTAKLQTASIMNMGIIRYDMAQLMTNIMKQNGFAASDAEKTAAKSQITDRQYIPYAYEDAVLNVYALGVIGGYTDGTFSGGTNMNRGQACTVIYRMMQYIAGNPVSAPSPETPAEPEAPNETGISRGTIHYLAEMPTNDPQGSLLANGKPITDDNIRELIYGLKKDYPEGMPWGEDDFYASIDMPNVHLSACLAFARMCSDTAFGNIPIDEPRPVDSFDRIRVGDMVWYDDSTHTVIVLEKHENSLIIAEGNYNGMIRWGRTLTRERVEASPYMVQTRYPA